MEVPDAAETWKLLFDGSFQNGSIRGFTQDAVDNQSIVLMGAPWDGGTQAARLRVKVGDNWHDAGYPRAELTPATQPGGRLKWGETYRVTTAFWFDSNSKFGLHGKYDKGDKIALYQLHGTGATSPPFSLHLVKGHLQVYLLEERFDFGPCPTGRRVPLEIVYSASTGPAGRVRVTIDGRVLVDRAGANHPGPDPRLGDASYDADPNSRQDDDVGYQKFGLYDYWSTIEDKLDVYLDDIRVYVKE